MFLNNYISKISEDKYRYFKCNFDEKNNYVHTFEEKTCSVMLWKNKIERKIDMCQKFNFLFLFFFFFPYLAKIWYAKCKVLPSNRKNIFYRNLHHPIQGRLSLLISKSVWHNFAERYPEISTFLRWYTYDVH